jgi:hypothetical protein
LQWFGDEEKVTGWRMSIFSVTNEAAKMNIQSKTGAPELEAPMYLR